MLRHDVIASVAEDRFHIYPVDTIDRCLELSDGPGGGREDR